jgi:hypothetical protein
MLEWIGLAAGIGFGIMGLAAYIKTNFESRQREREYQQRIEQLEDTIRRGQLLEFEKIVPEQKRLIRDAQRSIWIFSINSLGLFHEHREDMISVLKKGGSMRVLLLDPESKAFKDRERMEEEIDGQISGRLRAEYTASAAYCKDIINFSEGKGSLELRLHKEDINEVLLIIDPGTGNTTLHINMYPPERHTRGYIGEHRVIPKEQPELIKPYILKYENLWNNAKRVDL